MYKRKTVHVTVLFRTRNAVRLQLTVKTHNKNFSKTFREIPTQDHSPVHIQLWLISVSRSSGWDPQSEVRWYQQDRVCPSSHPWLPCRPGVGLDGREPVLHQSSYSIYWGETNNTLLCCLKISLLLEEIYKIWTKFNFLTLKKWTKVINVM